MEELNFNDKRFDWPDWGDNDVDEIDDVHLSSPFTSWENLEFPEKA